MRARDAEGCELLLVHRSSPAYSCSFFFEFAAESERDRGFRGWWFAAVVVAVGEGGEDGVRRRRRKTEEEDERSRFFQFLYK